LLIQFHLWDIIDYRDFYGPAPGGSANDQEDLGFGLEGEHGIILFK